MQVYQTDYQGFYVGTTVADPDPLDQGNWLIPAGCITQPPPSLGEKQLAQWAAGSWVVVEIPDPIEPEPVPKLVLTIEMQKTYRASAYRNEADPLFFQAQRGKATQQEWLDKIAEIEARFPYPEV